MNIGKVIRRVTRLPRPTPIRVPKPLPVTVPVTVPNKGGLS
jgi:hypothetical protein